MYHKLLYTTLIFSFLFFVPLSAQKLLQIEKFGKAKTEKIFIGQTITYELKDAKEYGWYTGVVEDFLIDDELIVFKDRFIKIDNISAMKYERG